NFLLPAEHFIRRKQLQETNIHPKRLNIHPSPRICLPDTWKSPVTDTPVELPAGMIHTFRKCIYTSIAQAEMPQKPIPNQHTINSKTVSKKKIIIFFF
ncbi:hypothetical protein, partial [Bacteroides gallinaceum]|uniref:hypothetical protein n=1 Tax=Bacteroides gallinaceum TaxID=1462571 RepID=UPI0025AA6D08